MNVCIYYPLVSVDRVIIRRVLNEIASPGLQSHNMSSGTSEASPQYYEEEIKVVLEMRVTESTAA